MEPFPDLGPLYCANSVSKAKEKLARLSLITTVLQNVIANSHRGIGGLSDLGCSEADPPARLLPEKLETFRTVRLTRRNEGETVWREKLGYMKPMSLNIMNAALAKIVAVATVAGSEKQPYGKKEYSI